MLGLEKMFEQIELEVPESPEARNHHPLDLSCSPNESNNENVVFSPSNNNSPSPAPGDRLYELGKERLRRAEQRMKSIPRMSSLHDTYNGCFTDNIFN